MTSTTGRRIVLTGATRGLGRALVAGFAERGHTVIGCGRDEAAVAALKEAYPAPHDFAVVDVSQDSDVQYWSARILKEFGPPDLLINNAAVINPNRPLWEVPADEFRRVIEVNVMGVAHCIRHFVPAMVAEKRGVIVNLSSGWGRSTDAQVAPYCASKFAIEGLTQALAQELPSGMAAIPLNPGVINTEMLQSCFGKAAAHYPTPEEWAQQAVPMLLELGPRHNGQSLSVGE